VSLSHRIDINHYLKSYPIADWVRIIWKKYAATPLGCSKTLSRFSSPSEEFGVLYCAESIATSIAETIVRDRFEAVHQSDRWIHISEIEDRSLLTISSCQSLTLLDLTPPNSTKIGINTDAVGARSHAQGQALSKDLYENVPKADGIYYRSRITGGDCIVVFDRSTSKLISKKPDELVRVRDVTSELQALDVAVRN